MPKYFGQSVGRLVFGVVVACNGNCSFECPKGTAVSIFGFGTRGMCGNGLAYPIRDFTSWWQGTLNKTIEGRFSIECQGEYLVYMNYPQ